MKLALFLLAAALALPAASVEETIKGNLDKFDAAAKAGDAATLNGLFAEDLIFGHSSAVFENKQQAVAACQKRWDRFVRKQVRAMLERPAPQEKKP